MIAFNCDADFDVLTSIEPIFAHKHATPIGMCDRFNKIKINKKKSNVTNIYPM